MAKTKSTPNKVGGKKKRKPRTDKELLVVYNALEDATGINISTAVKNVRYCLSKRCVFVEYANGVYGADRVPRELLRGLQEVLDNPEESLNGYIRTHWGSKEKMLETYYRKIA